MQKNSKFILLFFVLGISLLLGCAPQTKPPFAKPTFKETKTPPPPVPEEVKSEKIEPSEVEKKEVKVVKEPPLKKAEIVVVEEKKKPEEPEEIKPSEIEKKEIEVEKKIVEKTKPPIVEEKVEIKADTATAEKKSVEDDVSSYTAKDGSTVHRVIITDKKLTGASQFTPAIIHIKSGDSIEWISEDERTHFINSMTKFAGFGKKAKKTGLRFNSKVIPKGARWINKFTKPGTYKYHCFTHPLELIGKIIVEGEPSIEVKEVLKKELPVKKKEKETVAMTAQIGSAESDIGSSDTAGDSGLHSVIITDKQIAGASQFSPGVIHIKAGESIEWINEDARTHFINSMTKFAGFGKRAKKPALRFNSKVIPKGARWVNTFTKPGTYKYHCYTHPLELFGKIIVE